MHDDDDDDDDTAPGQAILYDVLFCSCDIQQASKLYHEDVWPYAFTNLLL